MQMQAVWWGATVLFFLIAGKAFVLAEDASAGILQTRAKHNKCCEWMRNEEVVLVLQGLLA